MVTQVLILVSVILFFIAIFILIRNEWVYKNRIKLINDDWESFKKLPSYDQMMFKFWVWDINKFIKE